MKLLTRWTLVFVVTVAFGTAVLLERRGLGALRIERDQLVAASATAGGAAAAPNPTRPSPSAPAERAPVEHARDEFDRAAIQRLQSEIDQLRARVAARERRLRAFTAAQSTAKRPKASITEETLPHSDWTNIGRATPAATIETALWAGSVGNLRAFDDLLTFDDDSAAAARSLFDRLPADIRTEYERPERIIALLTAGDVPLTAAQVCGEFEGGAAQRIVVARLTQPDQSSRMIQFRTRTDAADGTWRIVVPRSAIDAYAAKLAGEPTVP